MTIPSYYLKRGNPVKMIAEKPVRGMGNVTPGDVGFLTRDGYPITVDFLNHSNWQGEASEFVIPKQEEIDEYFAIIERAKAQIDIMHKNPRLLQLKEDRLNFFFSFSTHTDINEFRKSIRFKMAYWEGFEDRTLSLQLEYMDPKRGPLKRSFRYKHIIPPTLSNKQNKGSLFTLKTE